MSTTYTKTSEQVFNLPVAGCGKPVNNPRYRRGSMQEAIIAAARASAFRDGQALHLQATVYGIAITSQVPVLVPIYGKLVATCSDGHYSVTYQEYKQN